jgi:hypothetical protein
MYVVLGATKKIFIFGIQILLDYPCIHFLFFE